LTQPIKAALLIIVFEMELQAMAEQNFKRLLMDFRSVQAAMKGGKAPYLWRCEPVDDNLMKWQVDMKFEPESLLQQSLDKLADTLCDESKSLLTLELHFPPEFPNIPPEVWLRRPWLRYNSDTPVTFGGRVCHGMLTNAGWVPTATTLTVLTEVRDLLLKAGGEVDVDVSAITPQYPQAPAMLHRTKTTHFPLANNFKKDGLMAISSIEATPFYGHGVCQIEMSDRIALSAQLANEIFGHAEAGRELDLPLIFEVKTSRGRKRHCAVKEFYDELPRDVVVMPKWIMDDLFITERDLVNVRGVKLPLIQSVKIQPHRCKFYEAMAQMKKGGHDDVKILNDAFRGYSALTEDTIIPIKIGSTSHNVQILHLEPQAAVRIIDQDMQSTFEFRVQLVESPELEGEEAAAARLSQILARRKRKLDQKAANKAATEMVFKKRREMASRRHFENILASKQRIAGADDGREGEIKVMVHLPDGDRLPGKFRVGAPIEALEALVLRSDWAEQFSPRGVKLVSAFPRKVLTSGLSMSKDMHRTVINVQLDTSPNNDEDLLQIDDQAKHSIDTEGSQCQNSSGSSSASPPSSLQPVEDLLQDVYPVSSELPQPIFDELALQQSTKFWFEVQCLVQKGIPLDEAKQTVEAGRQVCGSRPDQGCELHSGGLGASVACKDDQETHRAGRHESVKPSSCCAPPAKRLRTSAELASTGSAKHPQVHQVVSLTALDSDAAGALLAAHDWNTEQAVNAFFSMQTHG